MAQTKTTPVNAILWGCNNRWVAVEFTGTFTADGYAYVTSNAFSGVLALPMNEVYLIDASELEA